MSILPTTFKRRAVSLIAVCSAVLLVAACGWFTGVGEPKVEVEGGDPVLGRQAMIDYGCISCHSIPGINKADAHVGPPLTAWVDRRYIGGMLTNEPENLIQWIISPQQFNPESAMPTLGVSEEEARDMAAYLYTLDD